MPIWHTASASRHSVGGLTLETEESGVAIVIDPLGGSWYVEALTDRMEADAERIFARIKDMAHIQSGRHPIGELMADIQRPERTLYRIALAQQQSPEVEDLVTVVYRREPSSAP